MENNFDYSEALHRLKQGKKVSCKRWGKGGDVYVFVSKDAYQDSAVNGAYAALLLYDTLRNTLVIFTPSVENQLSDVWYEVK